MYWLFFYDWFSINIIYENTYFNELDINSNFLDSIIYITDMHSYILSVHVKSNKNPFQLEISLKEKVKVPLLQWAPFQPFTHPLRQSPVSGLQRFEYLQLLLQVSLQFMPKVPAGQATKDNKHITTCVLRNFNVLMEIWAHSQISIGVKLIRLSLIAHIFYRKEKINIIFGIS